MTEGGGKRSRIRRAPRSNLTGAQDPTFDESVRKFRRSVWNYWKKNGRHDLPWRKTKDPYKILVSEVMLQQTQVPRVIEKYKEFLHAFPNVETLARSNLADVLKVWSGMGYNRRGKYLRDAAIAIVRQYGGEIPCDAVSLRSLPGVGPYTASAVLVFAFNSPDTLIETNVRAAYIHHFFNASAALRLNLRARIADKELLPFIEATATGQDPRTWHWALMDYGSHLKKLHKNPSRASAHYVKQSKFEGSLRQVRGAILRELNKSALSGHILCGRLNLPQKIPQVKPAEIGLDRTRNLSGAALGTFETALQSLERDGMIKKRSGKWRIA